MTTTPQASAPQPSAATQTGADRSKLEGLSPAMLLELLHKMQLENQALHQEAVKATTAQEQSVNQIKAVKKDKKNNPPPNQEKSDAISPDAEIKKFAHIYGLMHAPWVIPLSLGVPRPLIHPYSLKRIANERSRADRVVAEIYDVLPAHLHEPFQNSSRLQSIFKKTVGLQRATLVHVAKLDVRQIFEPLGASIAEAIHNNEYYTPDMEYLLKGSIGSYCTKFPPVIFTPGHEGDMDHAFRSPVITRTALLFTCRRGILRPDHPPSSSLSTGYKYDIRKTKIGFIAFTTTAVQFLASPDPKFTTVGHVTGIPCFDDFHYLKEMLMKSSLKTGRQGLRYRSLIEHWDREVFGVLWGNVVTNQQAPFDPAVEEVDAGHAEDWEAEDYIEEVVNEHPTVGTGHQSVATKKKDYVEIDDKDEEDDEEGYDDGATEDEAGGEDEEELDEEPSLTLSQLEPLTGSWPEESEPTTVTRQVNASTGTQTIKPRPIPPLDEHARARGGRIWDRVGAEPLSAVINDAPLGYCELCDACESAFRETNKVYEHHG
ncbi:hypothetical protein NM688_g4138 [Phlebia brevispora]|uniref:Uncharacterized protein n=1 Tax=Phlebia brevispora TaxID=194682 RepID=A0ACC1T3V8_9APHY|nr:hypothetical protein NM688_g4138 [Phlebia brevispora]